MTSPSDSQASASTVKLAYAAVERMSRELDAYKRAASEPIAIVGLGCRFPGGAVDADSYWSVLSSGTDAVGEIPADRWDVDAFYDQQPQQPGKMSTRWGGFLDHIDRFDHDFFGISRREAISMDPQQRLALEVTWEALENAGYSTVDLAGSRTGLFMGVCSYDFAARTFQHPRDLTAYASTGAAHSVVPGRISYVLDLKGPSVAVDSACSSSLVAVHLAAQSLRSGECDLALSGGVNVVLSPLPSISFSQFPGMVSADGRCKTFDAAANGYVRSEGCGIVVLKRLSDAIRDRDQVLAVLRGGAVNQDGRSSGVTAPNGLAQRDVLRRALGAAGVEAHEVGYIEAHGTGTRLGDPIEVEALAEVYGHDDGVPVFLGSSKTNIGHLEAASGIAGLIKVVLALDHDAIPANVHFTHLNPHISLEGTTFAVPTRLTPWPHTSGRRIGAVSSFGFSGTNAHMILEQAPDRTSATPDTRRPSSVLTLSAKTPQALAALASRYERRLAEDSTTPVADLCFSANTGRTHFRHRLAAVGANTQEIAEHLADFADGLPGDEPAVNEVVAGGGDVVFLFTGQGPQRVGMARELYESQPTFRSTIDRCDEITRPLLDTPLLSVLYPQDLDSMLIYQTEYSQPALFAVEYALAQLWRSWGIEPVAVLGHSFGEYAAACVAGAMSLEDALRFVVARGRIMQKLAQTGTMAVVFASEEDVTAAIAPHRDHVSIAAINGPANISISGDRDSVASICAAFTDRGVRTKALHITTASHSPLVEPVLDELRTAAQQVTFSTPRIPLISNLTGALWPWNETPDADYWCRHARQPVRFADGITALTAMGYRTFLEVGPAPTLLGLIGENLPADSDILLVPSLRPKVDDWKVMLSTLAKLYVHGVDVNWKGFDRDYSRTKATMPTYAFEPTVCWQPLRQNSGDENITDAENPAADADIEAAHTADEQLLYQLEWERADGAAMFHAPDPEESTSAQTWLVLADVAGVADEIAAVITANGARCILVRVADDYHYSEDTARLRSEDTGDLIRLLRDIAVESTHSLQILHLWSLGDQHTTVGSVVELLQEQQRGCMSAVRVVQALATSALPGVVRLWLVTRGAVQPETPNPTLTDVSASTLWGLGRSLQQEHAGIWGGLIDLDPTAPPADLASHLIETVGRCGHEDQIALRGADRYVARLTRTQLPDPPTRTIPWRPDATYLITGGLGGLGLATARSMVQAGARRLILLGRTLLPPRGQWAALPPDHPASRTITAVRELELLGASIILASVDLSDEPRMREFLRQFDADSWPPIRGVVHAAGMGQIAPVSDLDFAELQRHLLPKAMGAWVLHRLFADRSLDFFVMFSSTSSMLSSPFVASYAAANAFLDSLAQMRHNEGKPGLSINWGIWADTGLAARDADNTPGLSRGMGTLDPQQALRMFHRLLRQDAAQIAVVPVDWAEWGRRYRDVSGSPLLMNLLGADGDERPTRPPARPNPIPTRAALAALPADERAHVLTDALRLTVAATLGSATSTIGLDHPLFDLGLDSLMAVELRNRIEGPLGISLPVSILLEGASIRTVAEQIMDRLSKEHTNTAGATTIPRARRVEDIAAVLLTQLDESPDRVAAAQGRG